MLCEVCGALEATIHKTGISLEVSTVNGETIGIRHYCRDCYGKAVQKIEQPGETGSVKSDSGTGGSTTGDGPRPEDAAPIKGADV